MSSASDSASGNAPGRGERRDDDEQPAGEPGAGGADHEREHLRARDVEAGELGGDLVVAHRAEVAPEPAADEVGQQHVGEQRGQAGDPRLPALERERRAERRRAASAGTPSARSSRRGTSGKRCASAGSPTASASVAPAR